MNPKRTLILVIFIATWIFMFLAPAFLFLPPEARFTAVLGAAVVLVLGLYAIIRFTPSDSDYGDEGLEDDFQMLGLKGVVETRNPQTGTVIVRFEDFDNTLGVKEIPVLPSQPFVVLEPGEKCVIVGTAGETPLVEKLQEDETFPTGEFWE